MHYPGMKMKIENEEDVLKVVNIITKKNIIQDQKENEKNIKNTKNLTSPKRNQKYFSKILKDVKVYSSHENLANTSQKRFLNSSVTLERTIY